jgi:hypothetical protein
LQIPRTDALSFLSGLSQRAESGSERPHSRKIGQKLLS